MRRHAFELAEKEGDAAGAQAFARNVALLLRGLHEKDQDRESLAKSHTVLSLTPCDRTFALCFMLCLFRGKAESV